MKILEMAKDVKIKHSAPLPTTKYGEHFWQKSFAWGNKRFWANLWGDALHHQELMIR